jgi:hypothetical protein
MIKRLAFTVFVAQAFPRVAALAKSTPVKSFCSSTAALSMSAFDDLGKKILGVFIIRLHVLCDRWRVRSLLKIKPLLITTSNPIATLIP